MNKVLVLGDSHASIFGSKVWQNKACKFDWDLIVVPGATLSGLSNPNSKTNSHIKFKDALSKNKNYNFIITLLGEVDCGFVIWFYAQRDDLDIKTAAHKALINYQNLLLSLDNNAKRIVVSTPLPTIKEGESHGNVAKERASITSSLRERTELTLWFNSKMKSFCLEKEIHFIDLDAASIGHDGIVLNSLLNQNKLDHHYDKSAYCTLLIQHLLPKLEYEAGYETHPNLNKYKIKDKDIDLLRDIALDLESLDIKKSHQLMQLAHNLRPNGKTIKKKLDQYSLILKANFIPPDKSID